MSKRIIQFDLIRALCMLYIVGVWHLDNYLSPEIKFSLRTTEYLNYLTIAVLATFTYISGFFLRKYEFLSLRDFSFFYKRRALRIVPLFLLSAGSLYLMRWMSARQLLLGITGLALFSSDPLKTLWYISMLVFFYAITPLIRWKVVGARIKILNNLIICFFLVAFILLFIIGHADERLLMYAPVFFMGLCSKDVDFERNQWIILLLVSISLYAISILFLGNTPVLEHCVLAFLGCTILVSLGFIIPIIRGAERIISFFAYASMAAYLFHRQVFGAIVYLFGKGGIGGSFLPLWMAIMSLILVFVLSWLIQRVYDSVIQRILRK